MSSGVARVSCGTLATMSASAGVSEGGGFDRRLPARLAEGANGEQRIAPACRLSPRQLASFHENTLSDFKLPHGVRGTDTRDLTVSLEHGDDLRLSVMRE